MAGETAPTGRALASASRRASTGDVSCPPGPVACRLDWHGSTWSAAACRGPAARLSFPGPSGCGRVRRYRAGEAADLLAIGRRRLSREADVRLHAAGRLDLADPAEAEQQLDRALAFWRTVRSWRRGWRRPSGLRVELRATGVVARRRIAAARRLISATVEPRRRPAGRVVRDWGTCPRP